MTKPKDADKKASLCEMTTEERVMSVRERFTAKSDMDLRIQRRADLIAKMESGKMTTTEQEDELLAIVLEVRARYGLV